MRKIRKQSKKKLLTKDSGKYKKMRRKKSEEDNLNKNNGCAYDHPILNKNL